MKLLESKEKSVVIEVDVSELLAISSLLVYASAQYSHFDETILNVKKEAIEKVSDSIFNIFEKRRNK